MTKRVLIVDDEWRTLEGEAERVRRCGLDLEVMGLAENGLAALELVRTAQPDILLCDIHMPDMDGLAFTIQALDVDPGLAIIFISGYSEKEYLRTAIRLGAVDYLYKPVEDREFLRAMERAVERREAALQRGRVPTVKQEDLRVLLTSNDETLLRRVVPLEAAHGEFIMLYAAQSGSMVTEAARQQLGMFTLHMASLLSEKPGLHHTALRSDDAVAMLVHRERGGSEPLEAEMRRLCESMLERLPEAREQLSIGIGNAYGRLTETAQSYAAAVEAHAYSFFRGMGTVLLYGQQRGGAYLAEEGWLEKLKESVANSHLLDARDRVDRLFLQYQQHERTPVAHILQTAQRIVDLLEAKHGQYLPNKPMLTPEERQRWIDQARTLKELLANLQAAFDRLVDNVMLSHGGKASIFNAMHYIWNHVGGDLSLKAIAEHVYLSPTYLCALFKSVTGQTINQYIQMTRVERAQKLLEETDLSMGEIAQTVGYRNMRYFTKVFQSMTGQQPSAYRRRWRNA